MDERQGRWLDKVAALTREGRVVEATRVIQEGFGVLRPKASSAPSKASGLVKPAWLKSIGSLVRSRPTGEAPVSHVIDDPAVVPRTEFVEATHAHGGLTRRYKLFVPSRLEPSPKLVVMLHGCTQDSDDFAAGTGMNERAERDGFLVLYPQQSRNDNPSSCWNWFNRKDQQRDSGEAGLLAHLVRTIVERHAVDPGRVYVAGLSAGGAMADILASQYPEVFAAAAVHSGLPAGAAGNIPDALSAMRNGRPKSAAPAGSAVPTIVFHGDADATVHPANGEAVVQAVLARSAATVTRETPTVGQSPRFTRTRHIDALGSVLVESWTLHGAGHAWAGGRSAGSYTDPKGIDATGRVLDFFDAHRR